VSAEDRAAGRLGPDSWVKQADTATEGAGVTGSDEAAVDGADDDVAAAEAAVEADLAAIAAERDDYLDALRRLQADFDNFRKRTLRQQTEHLDQAAARLVERLLPVLDAGDLAVAHGGGEAVEQVVGLLRDVLAKEGLEVVAPEPGSPFDPTMHEAVVHEPADGDPQVAEVMRAGYRWRGRLVRAAMVKVKG
jgi:molecular chaperone GrpE